MKKVFAAILLLALAAPSFAVSFSLSDLGSGKIRISFNVPTGEVLRGLALKVSTTVGNATIAGSAAVTAIDPRFNVFPDYAFSHAVGYTIGAGNPLALTAGAGELTIFPASTFVLCMGALDQSGAQGGVTGNGTLCEIQYNITANATIHIEGDTLRGGAVVGDNVTQPTAIDMPVPNVCIVSNAAVVKTTAAPAAATLVNGGRTETFTASATSSQGHALEYQFNWGDGITGAYGAAAQSHVYSYTAAATYNVVVTARCTVDGFTSVSPALVLTTEPMRSTAAGTGRPAGEAYAAWAQFSRPNCWAFKRNCRGDANGLKSGLSNFIWVNSLDLAIFSAAYNKTTTDLLPVVVAGTSGICADNNRLRSGLSNFIWVNSADLAIFSAYYNKTESNTPVCDQTNYHYWTN